VRVAAQRTGIPAHVVLVVQRERRVPFAPDGLVQPAIRRRVPFAPDGLVQPTIRRRVPFAPAGLV